MTLACHSYKLPFSKPLKTSNQIFQYRKGFVLFHTKKEQEFFGEVAPLPGFSAENHKSVKKILLAHQQTLENKLDSSKPIDELKQFYRDADIPPSLQFGLDTLAYQIKAQQNNQSLFPYLFPDSAKKVPVNALISLQEDTVLNTVERNITSGYQTIKCKIGLHFEQELPLLRKIRNKYPKLTIRVDANQAWSLDQAVEYCNQLNDLNIEYCEEPLVEPTPKNLEQLSQHTALPLALDESTAQHPYWPNLLPFTKYLIIKPMVVGSFQKNIETKRLANTHNNKVVITTSLESSVGRYFIDLMAAGLGSPLIAHGLSTGFLLAKDISSDKNIFSEGYLNISSQPVASINFEQQKLFKKLF